MTNQTQSNIPLELVGRNQTYRYLQTPVRPAYPKGDEVKYSDDFLLELNNQYPTKDILGKQIETLAQRKGLEHFVMDSPLQNTEGEDILGYMLINSAQAQRWQPFIIDVPYLTDTPIQTANEYLQEVGRKGPQSAQGMVDGGLIFGLAMAKRGRLALPIEYDNKVIVIPSQEFVEYIAKRKK